MSETGVKIQSWVKLEQSTGAERAGMSAGPGEGNSADLPFKSGITCGMCDTMLMYHAVTVIKHKRIPS